MLKGDVPPNRVAELARDRGIDFEITAEVEGLLRQAGATDELIAALRELAPRGAVSTPPAPAPRENPKDGLKYVWIPPGTFMMGCSPGDWRCSGEEEPTHQVTITKGFWIGQTPVTVGAYKRFARATGRQMPEAPSFNAGWANENMPIVYVDWHDAQAYCGWTGGRLPTEAEWEYAARAGNTKERYGPIDEIGWGAPNSWGRTHDVAEKRANAFGLYDMLGNVFEWASDWFDENYYRSSPAQDPQGPASGRWRVLRGGWRSQVTGVVRVSNRDFGDPSHIHEDIGFRCGGEVVNP
jgi:formylglycine-generating enzyme required for sulfatase activity